MPAGPLLLARHNFSAALASHSPILVLYVAAAALSGMATPAPLSAAAALLHGKRGAVAMCADAQLAVEAGAVTLPALRLHHHPAAKPARAVAYAGAVSGEEMAAFVTRHARDVVVEVDDATALRRELHDSIGGGGAALVLFAAPSASPHSLSALRSLASDPTLRSTAFLSAAPALYRDFCLSPVDSSAGACEPTTRDDVFMDAASVPVVSSAPSAAPTCDGPGDDLASPILFLRRGEAVAYEGAREREAMRGWLLARVSPLLAEVSASSYEQYRLALGAGGADGESGATAAGATADASCEAQSGGAADRGAAEQGASGATVGETTRNGASDGHASRPGGSDAADATAEASRDGRSDGGGEDAGAMAAANMPMVWLLLNATRPGSRIEAGHRARVAQVSTKIMSRP